MVTATASGEGRASTALNLALESARQQGRVLGRVGGVLLVVTGPPDIQLSEAFEAACQLEEVLPEDYRLLVAVLPDHARHDCVSVHILGVEM